MDRAELERLDRDSLIARAEAAGVSRARILTRPELVDELLLRAPSEGDAGSANVAKARGFFGRARDLLARVIERGLHLPDAAEKIRGASLVPPPRTAASALPTVTLAEIYAAQGHRDRALETLRRVIEREPDHAAARALVAQLESASFDGPAAPALPPEEEELTPPVAAPAAETPAEPSGMLDDAPLPPRYDVDECVAIPVDPTTLFVYWEIRERTLEHLQKTRPGGTIAVRFVVITPTWDGPRSAVRDHDVNAALGDWFARDLPPACVVRAAIGWRTGDLFVPVAHSPALETPPDAPSPIVADTLVRWTPKGVVPVRPTDADAESILRALGTAKAHAEGAAGSRHEARGAAPSGSSEQRAFGSSERSA